MGTCLVVRRAHSRRAQYNGVQRMSWSLQEGHPAHQERVLPRRHAGSVPNAVGMGGMRNSGSVRARLDVLVSLVIAPD